MSRFFDDVHNEIEVVSVATRDGMRIIHEDVLNEIIHSNFAKRFKKRSKPAKVKIHITETPIVIPGDNKNLN